jgi:twinkle protein
MAGMRGAITAAGRTVPVLSELHTRWLESRGIDPELAVRFGISSADDGALRFPRFEDGVEVGVKFRKPGKKFTQKTGSKSVFWPSADVLDDPALADGTYPLIITEGELDALSAMGAGYPHTVSVPNGVGGATGEASPDGIEVGNFAFMWNAREKLKKIKRFIVAVDSDPDGQRLAVDLFRLLGAGRCSFVTYQEGCKDLNDVLQAQGIDGVRAVIDGARPYPVRGLYQFSDYPVVPPLQKIGTGWPTLDQHMGLFPGAFTVVTGVPGQGKTTWVLNLSVNIARAHGWRTAVFSPEMPTVPHLFNKLRRIASGLPLYRVEQDRDLCGRVDRFLNDAFCLIDADPVEGIDEDMTLEWVIERAHDAVHRHGIQHLVVDPWNEVEHARPHNESMPDYIGRGIRQLKRFAKDRQVAVTVIVHPTKAVGQSETPRLPTLYDCEGSAHWYNKPDLGIVVGRDPENPMGDETIIRVAKVRFDETGERGDVKLRYIKDSCRFEMLAPLTQENAA